MNNPYLPKAYKILSIKKETAIDWTYEVEYNGELIGGQFMEISLPGVGEAPISISDFTENSLFMTIRKVGRLTDQLFEASVGDSIFMRGPYGNGFDLQSFYGKDLAIIAGGTGLAPVKNTIEHFIDNKNLVKNIEIICGFKSPEDILFPESIEKWSKNSHVIASVDKPVEGWNGETGMVTEHIAKLDLTDPKNKTAIVVGPPIMMKFTTLELIKNGIPEENIWVSFERKMSCGIGKCGHCKIDETYVCLEGPVFNYTKAKFLID